jgi:cytochrome c553
MRVAVFLAALAAGAAPALAQAPAPASTTPPVIWTGVFSTAQAGRGSAVVATHCTRCHGEGRALSGVVFMLHWVGHNLARLLQKLQTMPPRSEVVLTAQ